MYKITANWGSAQYQTHVDCFATADRAKEQLERYGYTVELKYLTLHDGAASAIEEILAAEVADWEKAAEVADIVQTIEPSWTDG